jgi:hypothetical protein
MLGIEHTSAAAAIRRHDHLFATGAIRGTGNGVPGKY